VRSGQWRPSRRVVEIILKHDLLGLSVEALPGATPHPLIGPRWEARPRLASRGLLAPVRSWNTKPSPFAENTKGKSNVVA
jgi:hypothetical protein